MDFSRRKSYKTIQLNKQKWKFSTEHLQPMPAAHKESILT